MRFIIVTTCLLGAFVAHAEMGDSSDAIEAGRVSRGEYSDPRVTPPPTSGRDITDARFCAERPERCAFEGTAPGRGGRPKPRPPSLVNSPAQCSNAGDQVARPVYREVKGKIVFAGFECVQDNRGGGN